MYIENRDWNKLTLSLPIIPQIHVVCLIWIYAWFYHKMNFYIEGFQKFKFCIVISWISFFFHRRQFKVCTRNNIVLLFWMLLFVCLSHSLNWGVSEHVLSFVSSYKLFSLKILQWSSKQSFWCLCRCSKAIKKEEN